MGLFSGWRSARRARHARSEARRAELEGDLARASACWAEAGDAREAARVLLARGDAEVDESKRLAFYVQAALAAPRGELRARARRKRVDWLLARGPSSLHARDLLEAARELEALGEPSPAAALYARAGRPDEEARLLEASGDVDRLALRLDEEHAAWQRGHAEQAAASEVMARMAAGDRRAARTLAARWPDDPTLSALASRLRDGAALAGAPLDENAPAQLSVRFGAGPPRTLVFGTRVTVGRTQAGIVIPSPSVSARHLVLERAAGEVTVTDLASRNGTRLHGMPLVGPLVFDPLGEDPLDLSLGGEVPLRLAPSAFVTSGVDVEVSGDLYTCPLGPVRLSGLRWELAPGDDGWLELLTEPGAPGFLGPFQLVDRATLLVSDALSASRGAPPSLVILASRGGPARR